MAKGGRKYKGKRENRWDSSSSGSAKVELKPNDKWVAYYKAQGISIDSSDWDAMVASFMQPLPAALRINFDCPYGERLKREIQGFCGKRMEVEAKAPGGLDAAGAVQAVEAVRTLEWFPQGKGFQLGVDRGTIRKSSDPALRALHAWLIDHQDSGMLTRQEAVSMIPPLVLQVEPHHVVLDLCAAPGSKTTQILEAIMTTTAGRRRAKELGGDGGGGGDAEAEAEAAAVVVAGEPRGLVVANDVDTQRAYMLAHQCKRLNSAALVVTTHMGQFLPNPQRLQHKAHKKAARAAAAGAGAAAEPDPAAVDTGCFDRVLADVPCSGDGTIRKQPSILQSWGTHGGQSLHPLQVSIAMRGASLLKVGGVLVYSTCSLNPIENEAVVATLLRRAKGALVLEDARGSVPGLKARSGLLHWHVFEEGPKPLNRKRRKQAEKDARKAHERDKEAAVAAGAAAAAGAAGAASAGAGEEGGKGGEGGDAMDTDAAAAAAAGAKEGETGSGGGGGGAMAAAAAPSADPLVAACQGAGLRHYPSYADVPNAAHGRVKPGMFPPVGAGAASAAALGLSKCLRLMPHDQDTGGFFVARLRKVKPLPAAQQSQKKKKTTTTTTGGNAAAAAVRGGGGEAEGGEGEEEEDPIEGFDYQEEDDDEEEDGEAGEAEAGAAAEGAPAAKRARTEQRPWVSGSKVRDEYFRPVHAAVLDQVQAFFGMAPQQPPPAGAGAAAAGGAGGGGGSSSSSSSSTATSTSTSAPPLAFPWGQLYQRSGDPEPKSVTYVTAAVARHIIDPDTRRDLKVVTTGLKAFEKNSANNVSACKYRLVQESAHLLEPFMDGSRKVGFSLEELALLVNRDSANGGSVSLAISSTETEEGAPQGQGESGWRPETAAAITALAPGAFLAVARAPPPPSSSSAAEEVLVVVCWRGRGGGFINVMCSKEALHVIGHRLVDLGVHVTFPEDIKANRHTAAAAASATAAPAATAAGGAVAAAGEGGN